MYMLSMSIFPLWWSAFSEQYGRRTIYLISFSMFTVFAVLCAISTNIAMLIVFRILSGGASASVQAVGAGTIADIWEPRERGRAMSIFYLGPLLGPLFAPIIGGALAQGFGWRASMYFLAIFGLIVLIGLFFLLPETLAAKPQEPAPPPLQRTTTRESVKVHTKKSAAAIKHYLFDPLRVLAFLRFPPVLITVVVAAIAFGALFVANISIQQRFSEPPYNFAELIVGLMYIPSGLGYFTASLVGGKWIDTIMAREARKANRYDADGKLIYLPEDRMRENMWLANTLYPLGLLLYGWTLQYGIFWFVPAIGAFIFGFASMLVFVSFGPRYTRYTFFLGPRYARSYPYTYPLSLLRSTYANLTVCRNNHVDGIREKEELCRRGPQQLCPQHPQLHLHHCGRPLAQCLEARMGVYLYVHSVHDDRVLWDIRVAPQCAQVA